MSKAVRWSESALSPQNLVVMVMVVKNARRLISHATAMILRNPRDTLQVTLVPYLLACAAAIAAQRGTMQPEGQTILKQVALNFGYFVAVSWMAVAWHRHVLLHEPAGPLPRFLPTRVAAYLGYSALFSVVLLVPSGSLTFWAVTSMAIGGPGVELWQVVALFHSLMLVYFTLFGRFGAILPAFATHADHGLLDGWTATKGATLTIGLVSLVLTALSFLVDYAVLALPIDDRAAAILIQVAQWPLVMFGISALTSTYQYYVLGQSLD